MKVGVLAAQGAFSEHISHLKSIGVDAIPVRLAEELKDINGLIIPGGESTTICKMMNEYDLYDNIKKLADDGLPVFGTCAGMILLAKKITGEKQVKTLSLIDVIVRRNAFGSQKDSFEQDIIVPVLGKKPFPAVFIRAPYVEDAGAAEIISKLKDGKIIAVRQGKFLATAFHPELTGDLRFHEYFLNIIKRKMK